MFLYITTSRGLFRFDIKNDKLTKIISNWHKGIFNKPSKGFFGICLNDTGEQIITVSRENLNKKLSYDKSTCAIIHFINKTNLNIIQKINIENLFDVHQISCIENFLFLTETGKNRIQILNIKNKIIEKYLDVGIIRDDINHINAISTDKNNILIGLNNGHKKNLQRNSQIIKILLKDFKLNDEKNIDSLKIGKLENLIGVHHTHDIEKFNNDYLISCSYIGKIYSLKNKKFIKNLDPWTRGIAISNDNIFIGKSGLGKRKFRHTRYYDGEVYMLDKKNFNLIKKIKISNIGQLNDILYSNN